MNTIAAPFLEILRAILPLSLIESCGLKGKQHRRRGGLRKTCEFYYQSKAMASACDIEALIELVRETVHKATNIELIREVHIIGDL